MNYYIIEEKLIGRLSTRDGEPYLIDDVENGEAYYKISNYFNTNEIKYLPVSIDARLWEKDVIYKDEKSGKWLTVDTTPLELAEQTIIAIRNQGIPYNELDSELKEVWDKSQNVIEHYMEHPNLLNWEDNELYLRLRENLDKNEELQELIG